MTQVVLCIVCVCMCTVYFSQLWKATQPIARPTWRPEESTLQINSCGTDQWTVEQIEFCAVHVYITVYVCVWVCASPMYGGTVLDWFTWKAWQIRQVNIKFLVSTQACILKHSLRHTRSVHIRSEINFVFVFSFLLWLLFSSFQYLSFLCLLSCFRSCSPATCFTHSHSKRFTHKDSSCPTGQ